MISIRRLVPVFLFASVYLLAVDVEVSKARDGYGRLGYYDHGMLHGNGFFEMPHAMGRIPTPPYFAIHPPVYYSYAIPRTYGQSPYPYPGTAAAVEVASEPEEIVNPHVKSEVKSEGTSAKKNNQVARNSPVWITNPYVTGSDSFALTSQQNR